MPNPNNLFYFLSLFVLITSSLHAKEKLFEEERHYRIDDLFPDKWFVRPAIEPAIPKDYVLKDLDNGFIVWGKEADHRIMECFQKMDNIDCFRFKPESEMIMLSVFSGVQQTGETSFSCEKQLDDEIKNGTMKLIKKDKFFWGKYPILSVEFENSNGQLCRRAWVGLNDRGFTVYMCPLDTNQSFDLWNSFLTDTRPLGEYDYFCANGLYMLDGYSYYRKGDAAIKVFAEKRRSDGEVALLVIPITEKTTFDAKGLTECRIKGEWNHGALEVTLSGTMIDDSGKTFAHVVSNMFITILPKEVDAFSLDELAKKHPEGQLMFGGARKE